MTRYIIRKYLDGSDKNGRKRAGIILGLMGIFFDLLLFAVKQLAGILSGSVAVTADAFNNLADAGAHIMALLAFPLGNRKPSKRFPFGCGRLEYLSGLVISAAILYVSVRMAASSVGKIIRPAAVDSSPVVLIILLFSIAVKGYMYRYNKVIGKRMDSAGLRSVATDSLCDCFATGAIILSMLIQRITGLNIDGWTGLTVAVGILYAGIVSARDSIAPLLGRAVDDETLDILYLIFESCDGLIEVDNIAVHDYGPDHKLLTMRAVVGSDEETIGQVKRLIAEQLNMDSIIEIKKIGEVSHIRPQS